MSPYSNLRKPPSVGKVGHGGPSKMTVFFLGGDMISHKQLTFIFPCSLYIMFMEYLLRCSDICFLLLFTMNFHQLILDWMSPSLFRPYFLPFLSSISHHFHINFHINLSRNPLQDEPLLVIHGVITPYKWPYAWVAGVITPYNWFSGPTL